MRGSKGFEIGRPARLGVYLCTMAVLLLAVCGCGEQLTRMEENQIKLQAMVAANARELATLSSQIHTGQGKLTDGIRNLDAQAQGIATEIQTVQGDQRRLQETVVAGHQGLDAKATGLQEGQQSIRNDVAQVQDIADHTASDLTALAQRHAALHETVQANQREFNERVGVVVSNQQGIQAGVTRLQQADEGLARDIASVAGKQDALATTIRDNDRQAAERLATLAAGHDRLSADLSGIADGQTALHAAVLAGDKTLGDKIAVLERNQADQMAALITAMAAEQTLIQESLQGNHESLTAQIAGLSVNQQTLRSGIDTLRGKMDQAQADSATATSSLQETLRISRDVVTGQMAASLQNQQSIQTAVEELNGKADGLATNLATVSAEQAAARETSRTNHDAIVAAMTGLSDGQQTLGAGLDRIGGALASMGEEQKAQHETARMNQEAVVARLGNLSKSQDDLHAGVNTLSQKADAASAELSAAAQRQNTLQQNLKTGLADLGAATQQMSTDLTAVASTQDDFRRMQQNHNDAMTARAAELADGQRAIRNQMDTLTTTTNQTALSMLTLNNGQATFQQAMQTGMNGLHERADQTAADVRGMAERQTAFQAGIQASNESLVAQTTAVAEGQQALKADLGKTAHVVDRAYADLTAVALAQETLQSTLSRRSDDLTSRVARIEGNQQTLGDNLDVLTATTGQTALDVLGLANGQADLRQSLQTGNDAVLAKTTSLAENQKALGDSLDVLTATTGQTALDTLALANDQTRLAQTVQGGLANLGERADCLAANQQQMQSGLEVLTATAGQTALDVIAVTARQDTLQKALQSHDASVGSRMVALADNQEKLQTGVDVLTATTGQTARDVITVTERQDTLQKAIQSHDASADNRTAKLADNQQKLQAGLNAVTATTGQTVRDIATLSEAHAKSEQTAQAGREEVAGKLAAIAQDQQAWLQRFDTAQARIQAMADGVATLDQQLAKLQGVLQAGVQSTTTLLDTNGQQRQQFEARIAQDVQAMIDAIAQIRQAQTQLQEQMGQVQKSTQTQAETLKTTLDQMKAAPGKDNRVWESQQPPAEVKVSDAAKVEPAVVQTGE